MIPSRLDRRPQSEQPKSFFIKNQQTICRVCYTSLLFLLAQTLRVIDFYEPKREKIAEFRSPIVDFNGVMRKGAETDWYTIWSSLSGRSEYIQIQDYEHWADLDSPRKCRRETTLSGRLRIRGFATPNQSSRRVIVNPVLDASLALGDP